MNTPIPTANAAKPSTVNAVSLRWVGQKPTASTTAATAMPTLAFLKNSLISSDKMFLQDINGEQEQRQYTTDISARHRPSLQPLSRAFGREGPDSSDEASNYSAGSD